MTTSVDYLVELCCQLGFLVHSYLDQPVPLPVYSSFLHWNNMCGIFVGAFMLRIDKLHYGHVFWKLIFHPVEDKKRMKL